MLFANSTLPGKAGPEGAAGAALMSERSPPDPANPARMTGFGANRLANPLHGHVAQPQQSLHGRDIMPVEQAPPRH